MKKLTIILLLFANLSWAQSNNLTKKMDSVTNWIEKRVNLKPGTSIIITKGNKTIYRASNGLSSIELNTPNTNNTIYDLASIAKMFTGYSIATLESQGKISMGDDIRKYLKDFPVYDHKITIGHLVHHTSGIKNWTYLIREMGWSDEDKISSNQLLRVIYAQKKLDFVPGEKYQYSNSGYLLLTKIIEEVTGQSFVAWTKENIFAPLKMKHTFFNDNQNKVIEKMASAYTLSANGNMEREAYNTSVLGSSSLLSNTEDMGKWMNFLLYPPKDKKGIVNIMFSTQKLNDGSQNDYAYGIEIDNYNGIKLIGHDGSWSSFTSQMTIIPEHKIGIFFANNYRIDTRVVLELYLEVFFPPKKKKVVSRTVKQPSKKVVVSTKVLKKYTGTYKLGDAWYLDISLKGNDLYTRSNGESAFYMKPINDSTFVVRSYGNRTITFNSNSKGKAYQLVYDKIKAKRKTAPFYFNEKEFKKYAGVYFSTELETLFTIKVSKSKMYYTNFKTGTFDLTCENKKLFFSDGKLSKINFDFDSQNQVKGLYKVNSKGKKLFYFQKAK